MPGYTFHTSVTGVVAAIRRAHGGDLVLHVLVFRLVLLGRELHLAHLHPVPALGEDGAEEEHEALHEQEHHRAATVVPVPRAGRLQTVLRVDGNDGGDILEAVENGVAGHKVQDVSEERLMLLEEGHEGEERRHERRQQHRNHHNVQQRALGGGGGLIREGAPVAQRNGRPEEEEDFERHGKHGGAQTLHEADDDEEDNENGKHDGEIEQEVGDPVVHVPHTHQTLLQTRL